MTQLAKLIEKYGAELKNKLKDPIFFIEEVMYEPKGWFLTDYCKEWIELAFKYKRLNITAFRTSGKTEVLLINQAIYRAFIQNNFDGIIVSNSLDQSTEVLKRMRDAILENDVLRSSLATSRFDGQNKTTLTLKNGSRVRCMPYNNRIRMNHVHWIGMDEIGLYRDHDLMKSAVTPAVTAKQGSIHCIGTPMSKIDLIHKLRENKAYVSKIYPAWTKDFNLFKQRYPGGEVKKVSGKYQIFLKPNELFEEYDSITWSREFMCVPLGTEDRFFPYELVEQSFDYTMKMETLKDTTATYYIGIDFALSAESSADYTVIVVLKRTKDNKIVLDNIERWKGMSYNGQKKRIAEILEFYRPIRAVLDESSFGASFIDDIRRLVKGMSIEGFKFATGTYTHKKEELMTSLRSLLESNWEIFTVDQKTPLPNETKRFFIPNNKDSTRTMRVVSDLVEELLGFGMRYDEEKHSVKFEGIGTHDDMVVALALANYACGGLNVLKPVAARGSYGYQRMVVGKTR